MNKCNLLFFFLLKFRAAPAFSSLFVENKMSLQVRCKSDMIDFCCVLFQKLSFSTPTVLQKSSFSGSGHFKHLYHFITFTFENLSSIPKSSASGQAPFSFAKLLDDLSRKYKEWQVNWCFLNSCLQYTFVDTTIYIQR